MHIYHLLHLAVQSRVVFPENCPKNLIVEGAFLSHDWFRRTLRSVLESLDYRFEDSDVKLFHLKPVPKRVFENIHQRADEYEYRRHEKDMFPNASDVKKHQDNYCGSFTQNLWTVFESSESLESKMRNLLISDQ